MQTYGCTLMGWNRLAGWSIYMFGLLPIQSVYLDKGTTCGGFQIRSADLRKVLCDDKLLPLVSAVVIIYQKFFLASHMIKLA